MNDLEVMIQWIGKLMKSSQDVRLLVMCPIARKGIEDWVLHIEKAKARSDIIFKRGLLTNSGYEHCLSKGINFTSYLPTIRFYFISKEKLIKSPFKH